MTRFTPVAWLDAFSEETVKSLPTESEGAKPANDLKAMRHKAFADLAERINQGKVELV